MMYFQLQYGGGIRRILRIAAVGVFEYIACAVSVGIGGICFVQPMNRFVIVWNGIAVRIRRHSLKAVEFPVQLFE